MPGRDSLPHFPAPSKVTSSNSPPLSSSSPSLSPPPPRRASPNPPPKTPPFTPPSIPSTSPSPNSRLHPPPQRMYQQPGVPGNYPSAPTIPYGSPGYVPGREGSVQMSSTTTTVHRLSSAAPPAGVDPQLYAFFKQADTSGNGQLSERELGLALRNGDWTPFDPKTVTLMVKMFDVDRSGTIGLNEFVGLWGYLQQWRGLYKRFDTDGNGSIDRGEYTQALASFGYRLTPRFIEILFTSYDKRANGALNFDMFIQSMVTIKTLTDVFKQIDTDRDGFITLGFEQFLEIVLRQT